MNKNFIYRKLVLLIFFSIIVSICPSNYFAQAGISKAKAKINKLFEDEIFESSIIAVNAFDLTAQKPVFQKNSKLLLHPASTNKILTSAAALLYLGPNYEFKTSFYYDGEIRDSVCYGNIYIVGGGDPDFITSELDSSILQIKNYGINAITGNLYGDVSMLDSIYWGSGWMWDDDPSLDSPYLTPLIINNTGIKIFFESAKPGDPVNIQLEDSTKTLFVKNTSVSTKKDTFGLRITRDWMSQKNHILVSGELYNKFGKDSISVNLIRPEKHFLELTRERFERNGIRFGGNVDTLTLPDSAKQIFVFKRKLKDIIPNLNKESDNLSAEMLLRTMGYEFKGNHSTFEDGLSTVAKMLEGIGYKEDDYRLVDGSGLSHYNLITADILVDVLNYFYENNPELFKILYDSFPVAGIDGTLEKRMKKGRAFANVHAKTGTLSGVSCLAGYLNSKNKHVISFAIMIQNHVNNTREVRRIQDKICEILAGID